VHAAANIDRIDLDVAVMGEGCPKIMHRAIEQQGPSHETAGNDCRNGQGGGHGGAPGHCAHSALVAKTKVGPANREAAHNSQGDACAIRWTWHYQGVRIVIVEDHQMFREVLRKVCTRELRHRVVGEAADGRGAVQLVLATKPDLVLLDLHLPNLDGFGVVAALQQAVPDIKILVLSSHCDDFTVYRTEKAHLQGFVDKNTNTVTILKQAITAVGEGRRFFSAEFLRLKEARRDNPLAFDKLLTDRERELLTLIGEPLHDQEIASRLGLAGETVEKHRYNIIRKLGLQSTAELVRYAQEHGFSLIVPRRGGDGLLP